jgi:undecaprenyl-diphosphatase
MMKNIANQVRSRLNAAFSSRLFVLVALAVTIGLTMLAAGDTILPGDPTVATKVQEVKESEAHTFSWYVSRLYDTSGLLLISGGIGLILASAGRYLQVLLLVATNLSQVVNAGLKWLTGSPRPNETLVRVTDFANGMGFPSGHTMSVVVFAGTLVYLAGQMIPRRPLRLAVQAAAVLQVVAVGFSRVHLGAHWPSDVLGGVLWGIWFLLGLIAVERWLRPRLTLRSAT